MQTVQTFFVFNCRSVVHFSFSDVDLLPQLIPSEGN